MPAAVGTSKLVRGTRRSRWPLLCLLVAALVLHGRRADGQALVHTSRRLSLLHAASPVLLAPLVAGRADAFENAIPEIARFPKRNAGPQPKELGLSVRKLNKFGDTTDGPALKECGYGPNCFSTTGDLDDPSLTTLMRPWQTPRGTSVANALADLEKVVSAYPPGQNGVDGGGFKIMTSGDGYLYAQFESLKKGKIDDVEFAISKDGVVQVRSGGRIGVKADFGSNAKRLNYISAQLRERGWSASEITKDTHPYYFSMNSGKTKVQCVGINCPVNYELVKEEPGETLD
mmetsp:Transcript_5180/g.15219  ORF Transcript_5180/g.15219 Transcript_5180/m.15219 type:complete len:288 (-) Transcript_5180:87-950(-)